MKAVALISLGCAKNLVDSEVMLGVLKREGFRFVARPELADIVIVNTCGFIGPAREEAESALRDAIRLKKKDPRKKIVAAGCYVERDRAALEAAFPAVDAWTGVRGFDRIGETVRGMSFPDPDRVFLYSDDSPRVVSTPGPWAYVKVSEGCSHRCGFCSIPLIKGHYVSRSMASIVREARALAGQGVRELNLVSHDTTWYGRDRGMVDGLPRLLERLVRVPGVEWLRFLYGYPEELSSRLLEVMKERKVCSYLDIPFQHADPGIVRAMKRGMDGTRALRLLEKIRRALPDAAVRTSLIVGFPGEGRKEFSALREFVGEARFDHLGVFCYSPERGTASFALKETVSSEEKENRRAEIMSLQAGISLAANKSRIGKTVDVLVEAPDPAQDGWFVGRGPFQAPEVDGLIRVNIPRGHPSSQNAIVRAEITGADTYDLEGRLCG